MSGSSSEVINKAAVNIKAESAPDRDSLLLLIDWPLLVSIVTLAFLGATMIFSASMPFAEKQYGDPFYFIYRQLIFLSLGVALGFIVFKLPVDEWERYGPILFIMALLLLMLVLVPGVGKMVNGSRRWLNFGFTTFQVSEAVKLFIIVYLAGYLVRRGEKVQTDLGAFLRPLGLICIAGFLLMMEPDFGATVVIVLTAMGMLFVGGVQFRQFLMLITAFAATAAFLVWISPYRMKRLTSFLNPWADPYNDGFQLSQSLIAIGSGSWSGVGLGGSVQKLLYLPESHTDFLFAVYAEEMGLIGVLALITLISFISWRCLKIAEQADYVGSRFAGFVALGIGIWFALQSFINIGVNMGALPTKGITLPLMSYGGSSVLIMSVAFALLLRIDHENRILSIGRIGRKTRLRRKLS